MSESAPGDRRLSFSRSTDSDSSIAALRLGPTARWWSNDYGDGLIIHHDPGTAPPKANIFKLR